MTVKSKKEATPMAIESNEDLRRFLINSMLDVQAQAMSPSEANSIANLTGKLVAFEHLVLKRMKLAERYGGISGDIVRKIEDKKNNK